MSHRKRPAPSGVASPCARCGLPGDQCPCTILAPLREAKKFEARMRKLEQRGDMSAFSLALVAILSGPVKRHGPLDFDMLKEAELAARTLLNAIERLAAEKNKAAIYQRYRMRLVPPAEPEGVP